MAETISFAIGVLGVLYVMRWLWLNDDGDKYNKAKRFSTDDRKR